MSGSISLTGLATLRSGAGLVTLVVPRAIQDVVAGFNPSYMTHGLADASEHMVEAAADEVLALAENMTAIALGPGLGRTAGVTDFVARLYREVKQPMVVDADALFALAERKRTAQPKPPAHASSRPIPANSPASPAQASDIDDAATSARRRRARFSERRAQHRCFRQPSSS